MAWTSPGAPDAALAGTALRKRYVDPKTKHVQTALDDFSIAVARGSLTALVGPDGAGKTTLIRMIAGLVVPDAGALSVLGIDVTAAPQRVQDRIGYMPQRFGLYEDLSVQENLDLYADLHGVARDERSARYLRLLAMTDLARFVDRPAGKLSGGMKQKLGLACTLVRSPELLLLDEPTVGVDPLSRRELWQIVEQLVRDERLTVVVSTAYLDEAERCDQVLLMRAGRLLAAGTPAALRDAAAGRTYVVAPAPGEPGRVLQARLLLARDEILDAVPQGGQVRFIRRREAAGSSSDATRGLAVQPAPARLEDGFMVLLREADAPAANEPRAAEVPSAAPRDDATVIEVKDLVRKFGDFTAVANTSFSVRRGEVFGLLGPNGAGKTTTFRMLCGLLPATSGQLRVAGVDMRHAPGPARRRVGYVSQKFALYGNLSVHENLSFYAGAYGLAGAHAAQRVDASLADFGLAPYRGTPAQQLPGGYKQRLSMAAALIHEPEILFLDEPTSGADPIARREFWLRITRLAQRGISVVVTTHFMEEAEYCDRIVIQDAGRLLAIGTPEEVRAQAANAPDMELAFIGIVEANRQQQSAAVRPEQGLSLSTAPVEGDAGLRQAQPERAQSGFASRLWSLTTKETRQLLRDRSNVAIGLVLPLVLILLFGYGISLDVTRTDVAVVRDDASPQVDDALAGLRLTPYIRPMATHSMRDAEALLRAHEVDAIVRIAGDFSSRLADRQATAQLVVNGADAATARAVQAYVTGALTTYGTRDNDRGPAPPGVAVESRLWFNVANTSTWYLVPGLIVLIMTLVGAFLTSLVVAREWERGTFEALFVSPVRPIEILLAKIVPYFGVGMIGFAMCLVAARTLFDVPITGSLTLLVAASVLYLLVALGTGLVISSATKNQFLASQIALLTSFLPALMLSGFLFDLRNVPAVVRAVANVLPATHYLALIKTLFLAGDVWSIVLPKLALLAAYAAVLLFAALAVTRKRVA